MTLLLRFAHLRICNPVCLCAWQPRGRVFSGGAVAAVVAARSSRADSSTGHCWGASTRGRTGGVSIVVGSARRGFCVLSPVYFICGGEDLSVVTRKRRSPSIYREMEDAGGAGRPCSRFTPGDAAADTPLASQSSSSRMRDDDSLSKRRRH